MEGLWAERGGAGWGWGTEQGSEIPKGCGQAADCSQGEGSPVQTSPSSWHRT